MTCVSCKTKFDYVSGEIAEYGSSKNILLKEKVKEKYHFEFKELYEDSICDKLTKIELNEPTHPSIDVLNNIILKFISKDKNENTINETVKLFEGYIKKKIQFIKFINITILINKYHKEDKLDEEFIDSILVKNKWE
jgi:hypothetical protein